MPTTKDHAKIGITEWRVVTVRHGRYDDPDADLQHETVNRRVFRSRSAAVRYLNEKLPALDRATTWDVTGEVTTGTWQASNYPDDTYGYILDAEFVEDEDVSAYADVRDGKVEIEWSV